MVKATAGEALARIRAEIEREKAEALGLAGARLAEAIKALRFLRDEVEALEGARATPADLPDPDKAAARRRAEYAALRREAQRYHHYLIVQREAMGFRKHGDVDRLYPVPGPLRAPRAEGRGTP